MEDVVAIRNHCICGVFTKLVSDPNSSVVFDEDLSEFRIQSKDGTVEQIMHFCFWCGGTLPQSRRPELFVDLDESDQRDVVGLLQHLEFVTEVQSVLGQPDGELQYPVDSAVSDQFVRQLWYSRRWERMILYINVYSSGKFSYAVSPKHKP